MKADRGQRLRARHADEPFAGDRGRRPEANKLRSAVQAAFPSRRGDGVGSGQGDGSETLRLPPPFERLTRRQASVVLERYVRGRTVVAAARVLRMSPAGVKKHVQRIHAVLGVRRAVGIVNALHLSGAFVVLEAMAARRLLCRFRKTRRPRGVVGRRSIREGT
ncbi:MAG: helix-turn-helix transcriptional regulator [Deltaproteobacteria bacterium]|nr:helix-turn-helix transcriptional regulator [Deltaproteobacteria bacterium]